jgi:glycosyltransferase involved in cell wall biosynthesis
MAGGTRHHELATLLEKRGWRTTIMATPFNHQEAAFERDVSAVHPVRAKSEQGVDFLWLYSVPYKGNTWRRYANMLSFFGCSLFAGWRVDRPDVVIGSSPHLFAALAGWVIARRHRVPFVLEIRDLWPDTLIDMGLSNPLIIKPLAFLERFLYRRAERIVVLAESIGEAIVRKGVDAAKIEFIPNATQRATAEGLPDRDRTRSELGWSDKLVFIYAGAHGAANALHHIVEAARTFGDDDRVLIAFLGDGPEKDALIRQADGLKNVVFLDSVPKHEVYGLLQAADVGITSLMKSDVFEGIIPNKLFDYLAVGLPIVNIIPGETWRIVEKARAGVLAEPDNPASIAAAIQHLAHDETIRNTLAQGARAYAASMRTREDTADHMSDLLDTVVLEAYPAAGFEGSRS